EDAIAGAQGNGQIAPDGYCAWRTPSGWETKWVTGPEVTEPRGASGSAVYFVSPDARRAVFATDKGIEPDYPGGAPGEVDPPPVTTYLWEGGPVPRWLTPTPDPVREDLSGRRPLAASQDLRHGVFQSVLRLVRE